MCKRVLFFCFELISCKSQERERDSTKSKELGRTLKRIYVRDREKLKILKDVHLEIVRDEKNT